MFQKFAIAIAVVAAGLAAWSLLGRTDVDSSETAAPEAAVSEMPAPSGLKPLAEVIEFWADRVEERPTDYLSWTELGSALLASAAEEADLGRYAEAGEAFGEALDLNPEYRPARLGLVSVGLANHRFGEALTTIEELRAADPDDPSVLAVGADARVGVGDIDGAEALAVELADRERSAPVVARLARIRSAQGDHETAVELATEALTLSQDLALRPSGHAFYHFQQGHFLFADGQVDAAIEAYERALQIAPDHPGASEAIAFTLAAAGRLEEADLAFGALTAEGSAADVHGAHADVLRLLGLDDEAETQEALAREAAEATLTGDPDELRAERRHLVQYFIGRDAELAVELARTDLDERSDAAGNDLLAWALFQAGRPAEAKPFAEAALESGSRDAGVLYHAAAIHAALGATDTARELIDEALLVNPQFDMTEAADAAALADRLGLG